MEEFVDFLLHYYREIILGFIFIVETLILFLKRRPKVVDDGVYQELTQFIKEAEELAKVYSDWTGDKKLNYVLDRFASIHSYAKDKNVRACLRIFVEDILNTPTKKGGYGREEA